MSASSDRGMWRVFRQELRQIASRRALFLLLVPYPLLLLFVLTATFHQEVPTGLPVAVVDQDGSTMSRQIVRMIDETPDLAVVAKLPDLSEARKALVSNEVYGIVMIPPDMERDLLASKRPEVVVFHNSQMLTVGGIVARAAGAALGSFAAGVSIELRESQGQTAEEAEAGVNPIPVRQSPLFNPALDYTQFLLASSMPSVLQIFICASAVLAISRERRDRGGMARFVADGGRAWRALIGKLAPYGMIYLVMLWGADAVVFGYFGAPFRGDPGLYLLCSLLFVSACLSLGAFLGLVSDSPLIGLGYAGILTAPAFGFVGISFPRMAMNGFALAWGAALPLTPYLQLRIDQAVRGADAAMFLPTVGWLVALWGLYGGLALLLMRRQARPHEISAGELSG